MEHVGIDGHKIQIQIGLLTDVRGMVTKDKTLSRISWKDSGQNHAKTSA